ncbi:MAG: Uma2 family endonuclease [Blastocatellia bacterium]
MGLRKLQTYLSVEDYLAGEKESPVRHEYVDGQVYAMAGASDRHNRIALNVAGRLNDHLADGPCDAFVSDMKVQVSSRLFYYPDVMVTCEPGGDRYTKTQPVLIVEVLSPSTERIDRYEKLLAYRQVPSLQEYVLIAQERMLVEIHRRRTDEEWEHEILTEPEDELALKSVGLSLSLAQIYRRVRFDEEE